MPTAADVHSLAAGLLRLDTGCGELHLVPGVMQRGALPNVLRGEETQVFGALELEPDLAAEALLVLPGTHSKWVRVRDGRLTDFATYMTGELFAVLREHSILGRPAAEAVPRPTPKPSAWAWSPPATPGPRACSAGSSPLAAGCWPANWARRTASTTSPAC